MDWRVASLLTASLLAAPMIGDSACLADNLHGGAQRAVACLVRLCCTRCNNSTAFIHLRGREEGHWLQRNLAASGGAGEHSCWGPGGGRRGRLRGGGLGHASSVHARPGGVLGAGATQAVCTCV